MKKTKLKKLLNSLKNSSKKEVIERIIERPIEKIERIIEKPIIVERSAKGYLPILVSLTAKVKKLGSKQKEESVRLEKKLEEVAQAIPVIDIDTPLAKLQGKLESKIEEVKSGFKQDVDKNEVEDLRRSVDSLMKHGGGSLNQKISVNGSVMSNKYADFNLVAGANASITAADNNANKRVDITIVGTDTDTGITQLTGDVTAGPGSGSQVATLATVNGNVGSFGSATQVGTFTVNGKGLVTAASNTSIAIPSTAVTDFTEAAQDAVGAMVDATLVYVDATPLLTRAALTGDITASQGSNATTLASIIAAGGPIGSATVAPIITYDAKGRLTAVSSATITPAVGSITGLGTGVATALAVNVGSAGAPVLFNGAGGTPSSLTGTNISGTAASLTAGAATILATARTIAGVSFDGSANISIASTGLSDTANIAYIASSNTFTAPQAVVYSFANFGSSPASPLALTSYTTNGAMSNGFGTAVPFYIRDNVAGPNNIATIQAVMANASKTTGNLQFQVANAGAPATAMTVQYDGNVGIGTTAPTTAKLVVSNSSGNVIAAIGAGTSNQQYRITNTGGDGAFGVDTNTGGGLLTGGLAYATSLQSVNSTALQLGTNNTARVTILSGGNAGFGTNAPDYPIHVVGAPALGGAQLGVVSNSGTNVSYAGIVLVNSTGGGGYISMGDTSNTGWYGAQASYITIGAASGVGVKIRTNADDAGGLAIDTNQDITIAAPPTAGVGATYMCLSTGNVINSGATCAASLRIYKENEEPYLTGLETLMKLEPKVFDYKHNGQNAIGFIADDVEQIDERLVVYTRNVRKEKEVKSKKEINELTDIDVRSLLAVAIKSIQEQQSIIEVLTERVNSLKQ